MINTEYDHENLKWGKLVGPDVCEEAGVDPHSFVSDDLKESSWELTRAAYNRLKARGAF